MRITLFFFVCEALASSAFQGTGCVDASTNGTYFGFTRSQTSTAEPTSTGLAAYIANGISASSRSASNAPTSNSTSLQANATQASSLEVNIASNAASTAQSSFGTGSPFQLVNSTSSSLPSAGFSKALDGSSIHPTAGLFPPGTGAALRSTNTSTIPNASTGFLKPSKGFAVFAQNGRNSTAPAPTAAASRAFASVANFANATGTTPNATISAGFPMISANGTQGNASVDMCWTSWSSWYGGNFSTSTFETQFPTGTITVSYVSYVTSLSQRLSTTTFIETDTYTTVLIDDGFTIGTQTVTNTETVVNTFYPQDATTVTDSEDYTYTQIDYSTSYLTTNTAPTPTCYLPSLVSQCQSSWDTWVANNEVASPTFPGTSCCDAYGGVGPSCPCYASYDAAGSAWASNVFSSTPPCPQATITSSDCQSLVDAYVNGNNPALAATVNNQGSGFLNSNGYVGTYNFSVTVNNGPPAIIWSWPTSSTVAPGCTVGCGRCQIAGNSVKLLFWSPETAGGNITVQGPSTLQTLGTTLTSPTLYISYSELYASDHCKGVGSTYYNTFLPVDPGQMYTQWGYPRPQANGNEQNPIDVYTETATFNVTDLYQTPVPYSIYTSQPWCATWAEDTGNITTTGLNPYTGYEIIWGCPNDRPYEPILVPPQSLYASIDPAWSNCIGALDGLYDPPIALRPAEAAASITLPVAPTSTSALPQQTPAPQPSQSQPPASPSSAPGSGQGSSGGNGGEDSGSGGSQQPANNGGGNEGTGQQSSGSGSQPANNDPGQSNAGQPASGGSQQPANNGGGNQGNGGASSQPANSDPGQSNVGQPASGGSGNGGNSNGGQTSNGSPQANSGSAPVAQPDNNGGASQPIATVEGQTIVADPGSNGQVVVGSQTLSPGDTTTIGNTPVSVGSGSVIVGGNTIAIPPTSGSTPAAGQNAGSAEATLQNGDTVTAQAGQPVVVNGQTLLAGGPAATINGQVVSVASNGIAVDGNTATFSGGSNPASGGQAAVTLSNGEVVTAQARQPVTIDGHTLSAGGPAATINGQVVSVGSNGIVVGGATIPFASAGTTQTAAAIRLPNGKVITAQSGSSVIIDGQTLIPGGSAITVQGETISLGSNGLVVDGSTKLFAALTTPAPGSENIATFVDPQGTTHTAIEYPGATTAVVDGSITLTMGKPGTTINGKIISLASGGIVADGTTQKWTTASIEDIATFVDSNGKTHTVVESPGATTAVVDDSITITLGKSGTTIAGNSISLASGGIVVNGSTQSWNTITLAGSSTIGGDGAVTGHPEGGRMTNAQVGSTAKAGAAATSAVKGIANVLDSKRAPLPALLLGATSLCILIL